MIFPYTTIVGLATGFLFRVALKPWSLRGLKDWIERDHKVLTFPETILLTLVGAATGELQYGAYFFWCVAAFWGGYNVNEVVSLVAANRFDYNNNKTQNRTLFELQAEQEDRSWRNYYLLWKTGRTFFILFLGISSLLLFALLFVFVPNDKGGYRNLIALYLASFGCYAITYPLGEFIGYLIPPKYYPTVLTACAYLLIPFASPELTIIHILMMTGGGLCGGICGYIIQTRYKNDYKAMEQARDAIRQMIKPHLTLCQQLCAQALQKEDYCLLQEQSGHVLSRHGVNIAFCFNIGYQFLTGLVWKDWHTRTSSQFFSWGGLLAINYLLPKIQSYYSIYEIHRPSRLFRFIYLESFTRLYTYRILLFGYLSSMFNANNEFIGTLGLPGDKLLFFNLGVLGGGMVVSIVTYRLVWGALIPYVPSEANITALGKILESSTTLRGKNNSKPSDKKSLVLSYHLLHFMIKNIPEIQFANRKDSSETPPQEDDFAVVKKSTSCVHPTSALELCVAAPFSEDSESSEPSKEASRKSTNCCSSKRRKKSEREKDNEKNQDSTLLDPHSQPLRRCCCCRPKHRVETEYLHTQLFCTQCKARNLLLIDICCTLDDLKYTQTRFDVDFDLAACDAAVRGFALGRQFQFNLPATLSLIESIKTYSF